MKRTITLVVAPQQAGQRLDKILVAHLSELGRRRARALFEAGAVQRGTRRAAKGDAARAGDVITIELPEPDAAAAEPDAPLRVALETSDLVVVDKPAGQPTAPRSGEERGTLANALVGRYPETRGVGHDPREPGLLQRLDNNTSGLLLAARSPVVFQHLQRAVSAGRLTKQYLAVVTGEVPSRKGTIKVPLKQHPTDPRRVITCDPAEAAVAARDATTLWRVIDDQGRYTLLELSVPKAFRHQIRVHLAHLGCPIVGDGVYGGVMDAALGDRHALHASLLDWEGDEVVPAFRVESALPSELRALGGARK